MERSRKNALLGAAVVGILTASMSAAQASQNSDAKQASGSVCVEKNGCNGKGSCKGMQGGKQHDCKGKNGCSQNERTGMTEADCKKIGGTYKKADAS